MEVSRSRKGKADVAGNCSSAFLLFRAFKLCYNKNGNSRKKKMRPVGFMMRRYRNYEKIFNGNKAELASAPQSALAPQCLCGFSRLVLQDFRPVRGLIPMIDSCYNKSTLRTCKTFAPSGDWYSSILLVSLILLLVTCKTFAPSGDWYLTHSTKILSCWLARLSPRQGTDTWSLGRRQMKGIRALARLSPRQGTDTKVEELPT